MDKKTMIIVALAAALVFMCGVMGLSLAYFAGKSSGASSATGAPEPLVVSKPTEMKDEVGTSDSKTALVQVEDTPVESVLAEMEATKNPVEAVVEEVEIGPSPYSKVSALIIGTNHSGSSMPDLKYAEDDAKRVASVLESTYEFKPTLLLGKEATKAKIMEQLSAILAASSDDEDFILYFAGHGDTLILGKDERYGVLLPYDAAGGDATADERLEAALSIQSIIEKLKASKARHIMAVFDSCYSGWVTKVEGEGLPFTAGVDKHETMMQPSIHVMSAGKANELAIENDKLGGGVLTTAFCKVLEKGSLQKFPFVYMNIESQLHSDSELIEALDGGGPTPQFRSFRNTNGAFYFIAPKMYSTWEASRYTSMDVEGQDTYDVNDYYSEDITEDEVESYLEAFAEADEANEPVEVPEEKVQAWESRAAIGDPEAMVLLTEFFGRSTNQSDQARAFAHAFSAFDTQADSGKFALGRAYSEGYGVEKDESHGSNLIEESGFGKWLSFYNDIAELNDNMDSLKGGGSPEGKLNAAKNIANKAGPALKKAGGFMKDLANKIPFLKDPTTVVNQALEDSLLDLVSANPDYDAAITRLEKASDKVTKAKKLDEELKKLITDGIDEVLVALRAKDLELSKELITAFIASSSADEETEAGP